MTKFPKVIKLIANWYGVSTHAITSIEEETTYLSGSDTIYTYRATIEHDRENTSICVYHVTNNESIYFVDPIDYL